MPDFPGPAGGFYFKLERVAIKAMATVNAADQCTWCCFSNTCCQIYANSAVIRLWSAMAQDAKRQQLPSCGAHVEHTQYTVLQEGMQCVLHGFASHLHWPSHCLRVRCPRCCPSVMLATYIRYPELALSHTLCPSPPGPGQPSKPQTIPTTHHRQRNLRMVLCTVPSSCDSAVLECDAHMMWRVGVRCDATCRRAILFSSRHACSVWRCQRNQSRTLLMMQSSRHA